jgi:hypothetical protein
MAKAKSISLSQFTSTVHAAVKAAVQKHPKFKPETQQGVVLSYMIRGIPFDEKILENVTIGETQAFADEVASRIDTALPGVAAEAALQKPKGVIYGTGGHIICGIPPVTEPFTLEQ